MVPFNKKHLTSIIMIKTQKEVNLNLPVTWESFFLVKVDEVVEIMGNNLTKIHERGEKMDDLEQRAEKLEEGAAMFQKQAQKLKTKSFYENFKMKIWIATACLGLLLIIILIIMFSVWNKQFKSHLHWHIYLSSKNLLFGKHYKYLRKYKIYSIISFYRTSSQQYILLDFMNIEDWSSENLSLVWSGAPNDHEDVHEELHHVEVDVEGSEDVLLGAERVLVFPPEHQLGVIHQVEGEHQRPGSSHPDHGPPGKGK